MRLVVGNDARFTREPTAEGQRLTCNRLFTLHPAESARRPPDQRVELDFGQRKAMATGWARELVRR